MRGDRREGEEPDRVPGGAVEDRALGERRYPLTKLGAPELQLTDVVADLAQSMRIEVVCDGSKLVAARLSNLRLIAVRASYEELASALEGRARGKPILPTTLVELPRKVRPTATTDVGVHAAFAGDHAEMKRARSGAAAPRLRPRRRSPAGSSPRRPPDPAAGGAAARWVRGPGSRRQLRRAGRFHLFFLAVLAAKLGEAGVASLRCDDRARGPDAAMSGA